MTLLAPVDPASVRGSTSPSGLGLSGYGALSAAVLAGAVAARRASFAFAFALRARADGTRRSAHASPAASQ